MSKKVYFVTHRTSKYPPEKNAVMGCCYNDNSWVVTDHYDSEEKMINAVFNNILDYEILDRMLEDIKTSGDGFKNKADAKKAKEESNKFYNKLVKLFPTIDLQCDDQEKMLNWQELNKTCKQMTLENKKSFIKIVKEYHGDEFATWVGITYGIAKIK